MKKKTLDTLLKKKDSKAAKQLKTSKTIREGATVTYKQTCAGAMLSFPAGCNYPLASQPPRDPPQLVLCSVCRVAAKKYSCSVTGSPLCSLQCYKKNLALRLGQGHVYDAQLFIYVVLYRQNKFQSYVALLKYRREKYGTMQLAAGPQLVLFPDSVGVAERSGLLRGQEPPGGGGARPDQDSRPAGPAGQQGPRLAQVHSPARGI